ncbi:hypothetical protein [Bacillus sp. SJS]|uniref:hypothetical protein n=1 Tax=Bacillus sp. SJS TaxID=1423321 RepID=UPI0004DD0C61|nr:hypothetical protein [Bacillus sp. SJS]KZZ82511.1 hypothetical protein AS29_020685 [Bacillus sp. SJS]
MKKFQSEREWERKPIDQGALEKLADVLDEHRGQHYEEWFRLLIEFKEGYIAGLKSRDAKK